MQLNERPLLIGVTGNIGSGKSSFCSFLQRAGLCVYTADQLAKSHLADPDVISALREHFGEQIIDGDGTDSHQRASINKSALAKVVFSDPAKVQFLNNLLHPLVLKDMDDLVRQSLKDYLVFEVPLLFEARLEDCFDFLILITSSDRIRNQRLGKRDNNTSEERSSFQIHDYQKRDRVHLMVENDGDLCALEANAKLLLARLPQISKRLIKPFSM